MKLSFTGTREGMTWSQKRRFRLHLEERAVDVVIHGDCVGADKDCDDIAAELGIRREVYPSNIPATQAGCGDRGAHRMAPPGRPKDRNITIAHRGDELFAAPKGMVEEVRSGTWHCVRVARKFDRKIVIAWPDEEPSG